MTGILEQERQRVAAWRDAGLPDPVWLVAMEQLMRDVYGIASWRHADRDLLDAFVAEHGAAALPCPLPNDY